MRIVRWAGTFTFAESSAGFQVISLPSDRSKLVIQTNHTYLVLLEVDKRGLVVARHVMEPSSLYRFKEAPEIKRIARHRHLPKAILKVIFSMWTCNAKYICQNMGSCTVGSGLSLHWPCIARYVPRTCLRDLLALFSPFLRTIDIQTSLCLWSGALWCECLQVVFAVL